MLDRAGLPVAISPNMDAWLKTHAAEVSPTANALYLAAGDHHRLARTPDGLLLMLRAIREMYACLSRLGVPITPAHHRLFQWLPEPIVLTLMRRMLASESTRRVSQSATSSPAPFKERVAPLEEGSRSS